jgi:hypothetical protein
MQGGLCTAACVFAAHQATKSMVWERSDMGDASTVQRMHAKLGVIRAVVGPGQVRGAW